MFILIYILNICIYKTLQKTHDTKMEEDISKFQQNESNNKRPQFGNRILSNNNNVFQHNAWYIIV